MKFNEFRYALKTGLKNLGRHPFLLVASVSTLTVMLFLLSFFVVFSKNASHLSEIAAQQPSITISMRVKAEKSEIDAVREYLHRQDEAIIELEEYTPKENFEYFKESMGKDELWEDFSYEDNIPHTFNVRLADPGQGEKFKQEVEDLPGVYEVLMESEVMNLLDRMTIWINRVGIIVFIVLAFVSVLVVANMVRVAVLSRAEEINIMKYIGATKSYIQLPFVVEAMTTGLIGALLATLAAGLLYGYVAKRFSGSLSNISDGVMALLPTANMTAIMLGINLIVGLGLCLLTSIFSVRRHANV